MSSLLRKPSLSSPPTESDSDNSMEVSNDHFVIFTSRKLDDKELKNLGCHKDYLICGKRHIYSTPDQLKPYFLIFNVQDPDLRVYCSKYREKLTSYKYCCVKNMFESRKKDNMDWVHEISGKEDFIGTISKIDFFPEFCDFIDFLCGFNKISQPLNLKSWLLTKLAEIFLPACISK